MCSVFLLFWLSGTCQWLARKTLLKKPNHGEMIISRKPSSKSAYDFLGLLYCFFVLLCICVVSYPYVIYFPTFMAWYSLFVLKVPVNIKQTLNRVLVVSVDVQSWSWRPRWSLLGLRWSGKCSQVLFTSPWLLYNCTPSRQHVPQCHQGKTDFYSAVVSQDTEALTLGRE